MSEGRELLIRAIKHGIVIDHIPSEKVFAIVEILKLKEYSERITVATNMPSSSLGRKGIIKIEEKILEEKELNNISLLAPNVTINIIDNYEVVEKSKLEKLDKVIGLMKCDNPKCISNHENIETKFIRIKEDSENLDKNNLEEKSKYKCFYCEKVILEDEIQIQ
ncbi:MULTISPECIES: aspartate carbamoyltransferase regulatory subunit [Leptotrichia]|uniref:Aspartate carbamoyltransferase regulatory chain n=1 Tax=Leptotrichia hofstadii F0254 TaxID=634994 RepID=C9MW45_9FUSO|nr:MULTISPECIES: aspartate carbamoyltransferase regulatory subunit [Leptotrichia]EEX75235.1 aspartate carbamoyltransferase, regulatory subunit [Leptotrichia hofstadii F0254]ERK51011.1 aspartate carbamoyltransferase, regulatory subunit [Leptotrichia sp. oral taxon 879 str. F0557]